MANDTTQGILAELGLGANPRTAVRDFARSRVQAANSSAFSGAAAAGRQLGRGIGQGAVPLAGGLLGLAGKYVPGIEGKSFSDGARDMEDAAHARMLGMDVPTLRAREATQKAVQNIKPVQTGDPIQDQLAALKEIVKIANTNGDSDTALKAMQKLTQLEAQDLAMSKAEREDKQGAREERIRDEADTTGRTVIMQGDEIDGAHSKAMYDPDTGKWKVIRPDGSVQEGVDGLELTFVDPAKKAAQRDRFFETQEGAMKNALSLNFLTGKTGEGKRNAVSGFAEQADIVSNMTDMLVAMYDPRVAFADAAAVAGGADRVITFVDTLANVFGRSGDDTKTTYNGKGVSTQKQYEVATDPSHLERYATSVGKSIEQLVPAHIRGDTQAMQLFQAQVMRLAYLDARLQEPSNRGLSDNDIQNALKRIGIGSPDPMVFVSNQLTTIDRLQNQMGNLGVEFAPTSQVTKSQLRDHVYPPEFRARVSDTLFDTRAKLTAFGESYTGQTGPEAPPPASPFEGKTDAELEAELARMEAEEARTAADGA